MKKLTFALAILVAKVSVAQSIVSSLDMNGTYRKSETIYSKDYQNKKACKADKGRWLGRGVCRIEDTTAIVNLEKSEYSETYKIVIENVADGKNCRFEGIGANLNRVQLVALSDDNKCQITVGFNSPTTLSTWTDGDCGCAATSLNLTGYQK